MVTISIVKAIVYTVALMIGIFFIVEVRIKQNNNHIVEIVAKTIIDAIERNNAHINGILIAREKAIKTIIDRMVNEVFDNYNELEIKIIKFMEEIKNDTGKN